MTDVALVWPADAFAGDLLLQDGALVSDDGLRTAILISLFSDARAPDGAELPEDGSDRRGWWGDEFAAAQFADRDSAIGSTLWLLRRAKIMPATLQRAREAAYAALAWLIRDGIASAVYVDAEAHGGSGGQRLALGVTLDRPQGPGRQRWDFTWNASTGEITA